MADVTEVYPGIQPVIEDKTDLDTIADIATENKWLAAEHDTMGGAVVATSRALRLLAEVVAISPATSTINGKAFRYTQIDGTSGLGRASTSLSSELNKLWVAGVEKIEEGGDLDGTPSNTAFWAVGRGILSGASGTFTTGVQYGLSSDGTLVTFVSGNVPPIAIGLNATTAYFDASGRIRADGTVLTFNSSGQLIGISVPAHAATHQDGGVDELPVDTLAEAAAPTNDVSRALRPDGSGGVVFADVNHSELIGVTADQHHNEDHAARHLLSAADEVNGDQVGIDFTPSFYTPSTAPAEASDVDHLAAHLAGIDDAIGIGQWVQVSGTTTNATPTTIGTFPLVDDTAYHADLAGTARRTDAAARAAYGRRVSVFREAAGGAAIQGSVDSYFTAESTAQWEMTLAVSGNNLIVVVTGRAGETINWRAQVKLIGVG